MGQWSELSAQEKAQIIKFAIDNGVSDINSIRDTYNVYASGGSIHIDKNKRGTFTAAATKHGKSVQEFARQVLANKENYSPAMVRKAVFAHNSSKWHKHEDGGEIVTNNNRPQDQPQISWIENWLNSRKDVMAKNIAATLFNNHVPVYSPKNNTGDVRDAGYNIDYNYPRYNPLYWLLGQNPRIKHAEKIINREIQNIKNVPVTNVGNEYKPSYGMLGVYVMPSYFDNGGNYVAFLGIPKDEVKVHEFTHASHPEPQETYIRKVLYKDEDIPKSVPGDNKYIQAKELYAALQEVRYKSGLKPNVVVDEQWLENNKKYFENTYLEGLSNNILIRLFNELAQNNNLFKKSNNSYLAALGGSLSRNAAHWHEKGGSNIGGYSDRQHVLNKQAAKQYDPTLGFDPISWGIYLYDPYNHANGEENLFWNTYLGLTELPKAKSSAMWPGDPSIEKDKRLRGEEPSDFYSTTPRMDQMIQARLDTAGLKHVIDNYDDIQKKGLYKGIADKETLLSLYDEAKNVLNNPDSIFYLHGEDGVRLNPEQYQVMESFPLGMLGDFGVMWDRNHNQIKVEDAYNFPGWVRFFSGNPGIPKRPREMKIRANISLDPNKGSYLLRSDENWNNLAPIMTVENTKSTGGPLYPFSFQKNPYLKVPIVRYDKGGKKSTPSKAQIVRSAWENENPFNIGLLKNGMYEQYDDPNGEGRDVGPGLLVGATIPDKKLYTRQELDDAAYAFGMEGLASIGKAYNEKYGTEKFPTPFDTVSVAPKLLLLDTRYQNGRLPISNWPALYQSVADGNWAEALKNSRSTYIKDGVKHYDNDRVRRRAKSIFPGMFDVIFTPDSKEFPKVINRKKSKK